MSDVAAPELRPVRLVELPLDLWMRAREHNEELNREFALIALSQTDTDEVPERLLALTRTLRERFAAFVQSTQSDLASFAEDGARSVTVTFRLPPDAAPAAEELDALLDEADEYCRGGSLLTLATPDELVRFRKWYLREVVGQVRGGDATPWPEYSASR